MKPASKRAREADKARKMAEEISDHHAYIWNLSIEQKLHLTRNIRNGIFKALLEAAPKEITEVDMDDAMVEYSATKEAQNNDYGDWFIAGCKWAIEKMRGNRE